MKIFFGIVSPTNYRHNVPVNVGKKFSVPDFSWGQSDRLNNTCTNTFPTKRQPLENSRRKSFSINVTPGYVNEHTPSEVCTYTFTYIYIYICVYFGYKYIYIYIRTFTGIYKYMCIGIVFLFPKARNLA